jgi:hypothetical protein
MEMKLLNCPFCNASFLIEPEDSAIHAPDVAHPVNDCILSDLIFPIKWAEKLNRRPSPVAPGTVAPAQGFEEWWKYCCDNFWPDVSKPDTAARRAWNAALACGERQEDDEAVTKRIINEYCNDPAIQEREALPFIYVGDLIAWLQHRLSGKKGE